MVVETPIGSLSFGVRAKKGDLQNTNISSFEIKPVIPNGMSVEGCLAVLLRCYSPIPLKELVFSCSWVDLEEVGYANSGECLDAWEWEHNGILVMIGTEDNECLKSRISLKTYGSDDYPIKMEDNQIKIQIENFPENKELTLHYVVAWNSLPEKTDSSCWFAVDIPHKKILEIYS